MIIPTQAGVSYSYSDFTRLGPLSLHLVANGKVFPLVAFSADFAMNEIPAATCTVGVGRDVQSSNATRYAPIHDVFIWGKMQPAKIYFAPIGNETSGKPWKTPILLFDGYVTAVRRIKHFNKYQIEITLIHWLHDLAVSSALSGNAHVSNPADMTVAAVMGSFQNVGAYTNDSVVTTLALPGLLDFEIYHDMWGVIKTIFSSFAQQQHYPVEASDILCLQNTMARNNTRALRALSRIEGPDWSGLEDPGAIGQLRNGPANVNYTFGRPLGFDAGTDPEIIDAIMQFLNNETLRSYAESSFWTKLVTQICPAFGMAVIPTIDRALVIADVPLYTSPNDVPYKTIYPTDYDSEVASGTLERVLSGVIVMPTSGSVTNVMGSDNLSVSGCYASPVFDPEGVILTVASPPWLELISTAENPLLLNQDTGIGTTVDIFNRWAKEIFTKNALRGRNQIVSGRLRFDIAPGSIVRIASTSERFGGIQIVDTQDSLAFDTIGQVARVSFHINSESPSAGTSFVLSNMRTSYEYASAATRARLRLPTLVDYNIEQPTLFSASSIHGNGLHGAPLNFMFYE
jgi:hypothetical protein